ncbi:MAG: hypothetical protein WCH21_01795, partial [Bacteroidota bacterium]
MKKIFILLSVIFVRSAIGQTTIFSEPFSSGASIGAIVQFTNVAADWDIDPGSNPPPACNVAVPLSSGGNMLFGSNAGIAGNFEEVGSISINTSTFASLSITWNSLAANASSPPVTFQINNTGAAGNWTTVAYTNNSANDVWAAVPTISLPSNASAATLYLRWTYNATGAGLGQDYVAIDDIKLVGQGLPIYYWNGVGALTSTLSWGDIINGTGNNPADFVTPGQTFNIINAAAATLTAPWIVSGLNSIVNIGDGTAPNACDFTIPLGFDITLSSGAKLNINNSSTLTIANTTFPAISSVNIFSASTVNWAQASPVTIWSTTNYGNLYLSGGSTKSQPSGNITVAGEFNIAAGTTYVMAANATRTTKLSGLITCAGNITTNFSNITIDGSGSIGTLNFSGTNPINGLTLNRVGETLTLGNQLNVLGTVLPTAGTLASGGNLAIRATASNKGRIGVVGGTISGAVTVDSYLPGPDTGWALLGVGGISGQTMNDWYGQFPMAIEGSTTDVTSAGGYFESVQGWNETDSYGYDTTITIATALTPGTAFWTYVGSALTTTTDFTVSVSGSPVVGPVTIPLTMSAQTGTNLISNPYPSPISWIALRNGNASVTNAIYIYNANGTYPSYVNGVGTNGGSDVIPIGQGFFVEALAGTNLTANESNKTNSTVSLMKMSSSISTSVGLPIKLNIKGFNSDFDETAIRFHGSATNAFDIEWDARKMFQTPGYVGYPGGYSKYTSISTRSGNEDYSINSLPFALTQNAVIPVLVRVMATGQYTISSQDMQLLPPGACVTLKDKLLNITHNIKASPYVFTINDTTSKARFELTVCADLTTDIANNSNATNKIDESIMV